MKLSKASSSPKADDEVSAIAVGPINVADTTTTPVAPPVAFTCAKRGIVIRKPAPAKPITKKVLEGKGKKKQREASIAPS